MLIKFNNSLFILENSENKVKTITNLINYTENLFSFYAIFTNTHPFLLSTPNHVSKELSSSNLENCETDNIRIT